MSSLNEYEERMDRLEQGIQNTDRNMGILSNHVKEYIDCNTETMKFTSQAIEYLENRVQELENKVSQEFEE